MSNYIGNLLIGLLVLFIIFYNQIRVRQVRNDMRLIFPIILIILGLSNLKNYFNTHTLTFMSLTSILISLFILAVAMGTLRAYTVKLWYKGSILFRQGTLLTIVLWIASSILHLMIDSIWHTSQATFLIYYGITLCSQRLVVYYRSKHIVSNA
ncbi:hypothetical protein CUB90_14360 [Clostridium sp. CT7]|nr:hypothetical protein CUB90_14360 [Clostridium sp. CT7]